MMNFKLVSKPTEISQSNLRIENRIEMKQLRSRILTNYKSSVSSGKISIPGEGIRPALSMSFEVRHT